MNRKTAIYTILIVAILVLIASVAVFDFKNPTKNNFLTPASMVCLIIAMILSLRGLKSGNNPPT